MRGLRRGDSGNLGRLTLLAACVFLFLNGWELAAPEAEAVAMTLGLAVGEADEAVFAAWLKDRSLARAT